MPVQLPKESVVYPKKTSLKEINYLVIDVQATGLPTKCILVWMCLSSFQVFERQSNSLKEKKTPSFPLDAKVCLIQLPPGVRLRSGFQTHWHKNKATPKG